MSELIDISLPLDGTVPLWPGSSGFVLERVADLDRDGFNETRLAMGSHVGTHVDAPRHFLRNGATVDVLALDAMIGHASVIDIGGAAEITATLLEELPLPEGVERLLLKTRNSRQQPEMAETFSPEYAALTADGAAWLVRKGIRLVGIDALSIQRFEDVSATHTILLEAGIVVLEGLRLAHVAPGFYELICLPLPLAGAEAAPARVVLRHLHP